MTNSYPSRSPSKRHANHCTHTSAPRHVRVPRSRNFSDCSAQMTNLQMTHPSLKLAFFLSISGCFAHAQVPRIIQIMKRSSNIDGRILLFEYSIYSFHPYFFSCVALFFIHGMHCQKDNHAHIQIFVGDKK